MSAIRNLIHEIHRRSIWQVLGIYIVASWISLQVVDLLVDSFGLPEWLPPFALTLLVIGLPIVVATAFVQEGMRPGAAPPEPEAPTPTDPGAADEQEFPGQRAVGTAAVGAGPAGDEATLQRLLTWRNAIGGGVLAFALWGVVATAVLLSGGSRGGAAGAEARLDDASRLRSVAVLPFDNLSPDPDNAYFADGIHEDVMTQLSKIEDLTVISRTSVLAYRDTEKTLAQIGDELGVGAIVEGSVRRAGDEVRITAQLIDASTDEHLWADNFDRRLTAASLFSLQSEIAQRIAEALHATLTPTAERQIRRTPTTDLGAYDFYLQGRTMYALYTDGGNDDAIRLFKEAISRDVRYADPYAGLADAYAMRTQRFGYAAEWADSAEAVANHALSLDSELPAAYKALANALYQQGHVRRALEANLRAIELDPNFSAPVNNAGVQYATLGRDDEALRHYMRAYRLQPTTGFTSTNIGNVLARLGFYDRAERRALEILRVQPGNEDAVAVLRTVDHGRRDYEAALVRSRALLEGNEDVARRHSYVVADAYLLRDWETALEHAREATRLSPDAELWDVHHLRTMLGVAQLRTGKLEEGQAQVATVRDELLARLSGGGERSFEAFEVAATLAALGDKAEALEWAEQAFEMGYRDLNGLDADPAFDEVRADPRWEALIERMRQDRAEQRANVERWEAEGSLR